MRFALAGGLLLLIGLLIAFSARSPNLAHVRVGVLSGDPQKNYHAIVNGLAAEARLQRGTSTTSRRPARSRTSPVGDQPSRV